MLLELLVKLLQNTGYSAVSSRMLINIYNLEEVYIVRCWNNHQVLDENIVIIKETDHVPYT